MALTSNSYTGNGSTVLFSFTFPYLDTADIKVTLNGVVTTAYTLANATTIQFNTAPANGVAIKIYRATSDSQAVAEFYPGSAIRSTDLNKNFTQNLYVTQEANNASVSAVTTAAGAVTTANTALSQSSAAVNTANTASANASSAVTTANTASTNASAAVSTANTASSNASTAVTTANSAVTTANTKGDAAIASAATANTTAASAVTTANAATSTANTASTNAASAVSTANTASSNASAAVSTANTASANAATAVTTANSAVSTANAATTTATNANSKADQAIAAVASSINYTLVANVAAIPATPANNTYIEISNSTGLQSFTPLVGLPGGFVGDSGLTVRLVYQTSNTSWNWLTYFANNSETRYLKLAGGTLTGALTLSGAPASGLQATTKTYVDTADATLTTAASAAQSTANTGVTNAAAAQSTANTAVTNAAAAQSTANTGVTNAAAAQTTANAAVVRAGDTMTGALGITAGTAAAPSLFVSGSTNTGLYSPGSGQLAISTNGTQRLTTDTAAITSTLPVVHPLGAVGTPSITFTGDLNTGVFSPGADTLALVTAGSNRLHITSAGLVGIGTSVVNSLFEVRGTSDGQNILHLSNNAGASDGAVTNVIRSTCNGNVNWSNLRYDAWGHFWYANGSERMRLDSSGRLGIGTTTVGSTLHLNGTANNTSLTFSVGGTVTGYVGPAGYLGGSDVNMGYRVESGNNQVFYIGASEKARLDSSGRWLVGTTSGSGKLTVSGNAIGTTVALTDAATVATDLSLANYYTLTLGGNRTLGAPTNQTAGQSGVIVITQDGTGSRTLAYNSVWKFPNGTVPTLTTTASAVDVLAYYVESGTRITARLLSDVK